MDKLVIRTAFPEDKEGVLQFSRKTWEYGDYVPRLWDEWLRDPNGRLLVGLLGGTPVAVAHVAIVATGEAWVDGLRVAPAFRNTGIGETLGRHCIDIAGTMGAKVIRFVTLSSNTAVHRGAAKLSFKEVASFRSAWADTDTEHVDTLSMVSPAALKWVFESIERSPMYRTLSGLYCTGWAYHTLTRTKLLDHLEKEEVVALGGTQKPSAIALVTKSPITGVLVAGYVDGAPTAITKLALELKTWAANRSYKQVDFRTPNSPEFQNISREAKYVPYFSEPYLIFEKLL